MITEFLKDALMAGLLFSLISGPMGSIMVWRRMSFLGDTLAHAGLLGVALAALGDLPPMLGIFLISVILILMLLSIKDQKVGMDANLTVFAHASIGFGLLALSAVPQIQQNYTTFLFGDILAVQASDIQILAVTADTFLILLTIFWRPILLTLISEELAISDGLPVKTIRFCILLALAILVSVTIKIFGALLITALLITPAVAARSLSKSPGWMMFIASILGALSILGGLGVSYNFDLPTTPAIVSVSFLIFALGLGWNKLRFS